MHKENNLAEQDGFFSRFKKAVLKPSSFSLHSMYIVEFGIPGFLLSRSRKRKKRRRKLKLQFIQEKENKKK
jgi:hypothetical protein